MILLAMRALVIGGTGFIGRRLVEYLIKYDCEVTIATSGKTPTHSRTRSHLSRLTASVKKA